MQNQIYNLLTLDWFLVSIVYNEEEAHHVQDHEIYKVFAEGLLF